MCMNYTGAVGSDDCMLKTVETPSRTVFCLKCGMNKASWETKEHSKEKKVVIG